MGIISFDSHRGALRDAVNSVLTHGDPRHRETAAAPARPTGSTWLNGHRGASLERSVKSSAKERLREKCVLEIVRWGEDVCQRP